MSLHTGCCQGAHKPSSCTTFMFNPHGGRAATGKKHLTSSMQGRFGPVRLFAPSLWTVACQASLSGRWVLQARILEPIGQYWLPYLLGHCFLLPEPPAPLRTWCCRNPCDPSSCMTSTPGPQGANPSPPGQPQEQTPGDGPHAEVGIKPQVKPGVVWLRKKTQHLPTSSTSCRLNPHDQPGRLCVYGIYKRSLRAPTEENAPVLTAADLEARTHRRGARLESELPPQQVQRSVQGWAF